MIFRPEGREIIKTIFKLFTEGDGFMISEDRKESDFLYGGSFVPLALDSHVPVEEWEKGFRQMRDVGFNAYRAFVAWNRVERKEGLRDYSELDYCLELARKYGLKATFNIGGIFSNLQGFRPPPWLVYKYRCQQRIPNPSSRPSPDFPDMLICSDDPVYREKAEDFIRATVDRYRDNAALESWSVWNEPAGHQCYCPHTVRCFQDWLRGRYAALEDLNENWGTLFPLDFQSWKDVVPPVGDFVCMAQRIDWLDFCEEHFIGKVNRTAGIVRELDDSRPTTLNVMGVHARDFTKIRVDQMGISAYLENFYKAPRRMRELASIYMHSARVGRGPGEKIRILETDSGPRAFGGRPGNQLLAEARDWAYIGSGAGMILNWIYRTRVSGGHACQASMTAWDGSMTGRLSAAGRRAGLIRKNSGRILKAHPFPGQVGVLRYMEIYRLSQVEGFHVPEKNYCDSSRDNSLMILLDAGFSAEYLVSSQLFDGTLSRFRALLLPFCPYVTPEIAEALRKFVENGGFLISEAPFALKDYYCRQYWKKTPGAGLDEVFGFKAVDMKVLEKGDIITMNDGSVPETASDFREVMQQYPGSTVEGVYSDGEPAVISNSYGAGRTLFFGSLMTSGYGWQSEIFRKIITGALQTHAGISPIFRIEGGEEFKNGGGAVAVSPVTVDNVEVDGLYIVNFGRREMEFSLKIDGKTAGKAGFVDIVRDKYWEGIRETDGFKFDVTLNPFQAVVLFRELSAL